MAVFLHKEIKKFSAVNDSEAHFMPGEKRHEMQRPCRPLRFLAYKLVGTINARRASRVV